MYAVITGSREVIATLQIGIIKPGSGGEGGESVSFLIGWRGLEFQSGAVHSYPTTLHSPQGMGRL